MQSVPLERRTEQELRSASHESLVAFALALQVALWGKEEPKTPEHRPSLKDPDAPSGSRQRGRLVSVQLPGDEDGVDDELSVLQKDKEKSQEVQQPAKMERTISKVAANVSAAAKLRAELAQAVEAGGQTGSTDAGVALQKLTHSNFFLPELRRESAEFRDYIHSRLTAPYYQKALEEERVLNWAIGKDLGQEHRLVVLWAQSDGNCLLHAALLAMWGLHDRCQAGAGGLSSLRAAMNRLFHEPHMERLMRERWAAQIARDNVSEWRPGRHEDRGTPARRIEVSEAQLSRDWADMVAIAGKQHAFLDSVHVFAVAHALRRPIIVLASPLHKDPFGVPLTPVFFRGIYLPFGYAPEHCCRQPLVLCFRDAHFMPLVPRASEKDFGVAGESVQVPLADGTGAELPLRFALDGEFERRWELVAQYLDIRADVRFPASGVARCPVALIRRCSSHPLVDEMLEHFVERGRETFELEHEEEARQQKEQQAAREAARRAQEAEDARLALELARGGSTSSVGGSAGVGDYGEEDAEVVDSFSVTLPRSARPGDKSFYNMPPGCTEPEAVEFVVPAGSWGGDLITLTAKFKVRAHCIRDLRACTGLEREEAVRLLTAAHGDANVAAQRYYERGG
eukprot:TRINITY_DN26465_c0_g1_i1.p1 TRINITY_DN26465_c0_g1~~TRINITY_DN26465_c0_g1_i1.p1  ORF type:complete len:625 (-),score=167.19 TRINITY_DN26465_c0_g1_i1:50-1924(-)